MRHFCRALSPLLPVPSSSLAALSPNFDDYRAHLVNLVASGNHDITFLKGQPEASDIFRAVFPHLVQVLLPPTPHPAPQSCCCATLSFE